MTNEPAIFISEELRPDPKGFVHCDDFDASTPLPLEVSACNESSGSEGKEGKEGSKEGADGHKLIMNVSSSQQGQLFLTL